MKPGPAISTLSTSSLSGRLVMISVAIARGFLPSDFARRIAMLVANSPWRASRVRSTVVLIDEISGASARSGKPLTACSTSCAMLVFNGIGSGAWRIAGSPPVFFNYCAYGRCGMTFIALKINLHPSSPDPLEIAQRAIAN